MLENPQLTKENSTCNYCVICGRDYHTININVGSVKIAKETVGVLVTYKCVINVGN